MTDSISSTECRVDLKYAQDLKTEEGPELLFKKSWELADTIERRFQDASYLGWRMCEGNAEGTLTCKRDWAVSNPKL